MKKVIVYLTFILLFVVFILSFIKLTNVPLDIINKSSFYQVQIDNTVQLKESIVSEANKYEVQVIFEEVDDDANVNYYLSNVNSYKENNYIHTNKNNKITSIPPIVKYYLFPFEKLDLESKSSIVLNVIGSDKDLNAFEDSLLKDNVDIEKLNNVGYGSFESNTFNPFLFYFSILFVLVIISAILTEKKNFIILDLLNVNKFKIVLSRYFKMIKNSFILTVSIFILEFLVALLFDFYWLFIIIYFQIIVIASVIILTLLLAFIIFLKTKYSKSKNKIINGYDNNISLLVTLNILKVIMIVFCLLLSNLFINEIKNIQEKKKEYSYVQKFDSYASIYDNSSISETLGNESELISKANKELYNKTKEDLDVITFQTNIYSPDIKERYIVANKEYLKIVDPEIISGTYKEGVTNILLPNSNKFELESIRNFISSNYYVSKSDPNYSDSIRMKGTKEEINPIYYKEGTAFYGMNSSFDENLLIDPLIIISDDIINHDLYSVSSGFYFFKFLDDDPNLTIQPYIDNLSITSSYSNAISISTNYNKALVMINIKLFSLIILLISQLIILVSLIVIVLNCYLQSNIKKFTIKRIYTNNFLEPYSTLIIITILEYLIIFIIGIMIFKHLFLIIYLFILLELLVLFLYDKQIKKTLLQNLKGRL